MSLRFLITVFSILCCYVYFDLYILAPLLCAVFSLLSLSWISCLDICMGRYVLSNYDYIFNFKTLCHDFCKSQELLVGHRLGKGKQLDYDSSILNLF